VDPAFRSPDLDRLIAEFTERVPGVVRALVVSADGVPVAASGRMLPDDLQQLSVITSGLTGLSHGAVEVTDGGAFTQALVAMEQGTLVIMAIDDGSSLAVLTTAAADLDQVAYDMTLLVEQAGSMLTPPVRGTVADSGGAAPRSPHPPAGQASEAGPHQADSAPATSPALPRRNEPGPK
jgi:uncharacterized protein